jgi:hypothetical protein
LFAAEHARRDAITRGDVEALKGMLADTYYYAHINGLTEHREDYLARMQAKPGVVRFTSARDLAVQPRGG